MKRFLAWFGGIVLVGLVVFGATFCIKAKVNDRSLKEEWKHLIQQEQTVETEQTSKDDDVVVEDETQTEEEVGDETSVDETEQPQE